MNQEQTVFRVEHPISSLTEEISASSRDEAREMFIKKHYKDYSNYQSLLNGKDFLNVFYVSGYIDPTKTIRCTQCSSEFSEYEVENQTACPSCNSKGLPMSISDDVLIKINWHELRILTIWAENWAKHNDKIESDRDNEPKNIKDNMLFTVMCIAERLQNQFPEKTPITLFSEIRQLRNQYDIKSDLDDDNKLGL